MNLSVETIKLGRNGRVQWHGRCRKPWRAALRFAWRQMRDGYLVRITRR